LCEVWWTDQETVAMIFTTVVEGNTTRGIHKRGSLSVQSFIGFTLGHSFRARKVLYRCNLLIGFLLRHLPKFLVRNKST
jgi:hypothetical protein